MVEILQDESETRKNSPVLPIIKTSFSKKLRVLLLVVNMILKFNGPNGAALTEMLKLPDVPSMFGRRRTLLPTGALAGEVSNYPRVTLQMEPEHIPVIFRISVPKRSRSFGESSDNE